MTFPDLFFFFFFLYTIIVYLGYFLWFLKYARIFFDAIFFFDAFKCCRFSSLLIWRYRSLGRCSQIRSPPPLPSPLLHHYLLDIDPDISGWIFLLFLSFIHSFFLSLFLSFIGFHFASSIFGIPSSLPPSLPPSFFFTPSPSAVWLIWHYRKGEKMIK